MLTLLLLLSAYSPLPCAQNCLLGAEHGISAVCTDTATQMTLYSLMPTTYWGKVATLPCVSGERVRFEATKYLSADLPPNGLIAYRVTASSGAGESGPTPALITLYEGGITVLP